MPNPDAHTSRLYTEEEKDEIMKRFAAENPDLDEDQLAGFRLRLVSRLVPAEVPEWAREMGKKLYSEIFPEVES